MRVTIAEISKSVESHLEYLKRNGVEDVELDGVHCWQVLLSERFEAAPPSGEYGLCSLGEEWGDIQRASDAGHVPLAVELDGLGSILQYLAWLH